MNANFRVRHTTRIAPSPTGDFHVGSARTAYFNYLIAKASGGRFVLRIDDTDQDRHSDSAVDVIDDTMDWLGLHPDQRLRQSVRLDIYRALMTKLVSSGAAYHCDDGTVRITPGVTMPSSWHDTVAGDISITDRDKAAIDDLVLMRSNGLPTYHFASVVDDMDVGITWVVRGVDHVSNTPKHIAIWKALGSTDWDKAVTPMPLWTHVGLITSGGKKLSKRDGAASVLTYRDNGVDPDAFLNWILRMGWGPKKDDKTTAVISRGNAISLFLSSGNMRSAPSNMDPRSLSAYDRKYRRAKANSR